MMERKSKRKETVALANYNENISLGRKKKERKAARQRQAGREYQHLLHHTGGRGVYHTVRNEGLSRWWIVM